MADPPAAKVRRTRSASRLASRGPVIARQSRTATRASTRGRGRPSRAPSSTPEHQEPEQLHPTNRSIANNVKTLKETVAGLVAVVQHLTADAARRFDTSGPAPAAALGAAPAAASTSAPEDTSAMTSNSTCTVTLATDTQHPTMLGGECNEATNIHMLINTNTKARPVLLSAGLAAGAHIPDRIKQKIWADKYIDFQDLQQQTHTSKYSMSLNETGSTPTLQFTPHRKRPLTEGEWSSAWDDYLAVYTIKRPQSLCDMLTYSKMIKDLMKTGADWRSYDQQFRADREHNQCSWAAIRVDLQIAATLKMPNNTRNNQPFRHNQNNYPFRFRAQQKTPPVGYCYEYHKPNTKCFVTNCPYKHVCPRCSQKHPMSRQCMQLNQLNQITTQSNNTSTPRAGVHPAYPSQSRPTK